VAPTLRGWLGAGIGHKIFLLFCPPQYPVGHADVPHLPPGDAEQCVAGEKDCLAGAGHGAIPASCCRGKQISATPSWSQGRRIRCRRLLRLSARSCRMKFSVSMPRVNREPQKPQSTAAWRRGLSFRVLPQMGHHMPTTVPCRSSARACSKMCRWTCACSATSRNSSLTGLLYGAAQEPE